jgi:hypothetical protein
MDDYGMTTVWLWYDYGMIVKYTFMVENSLIIYM